MASCSLTRGVLLCAMLSTVPGCLQADRPPERCAPASLLRYCDVAVEEHARVVGVQACGEDDRWGPCVSWCGALPEGLECEPVHDVERWYVVSRLDLADDYYDPGVNLDCRVSSEADAQTCFVPDTTIVDDDDPIASREYSMDGVDNSLGTLGGVSSPYMIESSSADAIARGDLLLLIRVRGDPVEARQGCVAAELWWGRAPGGGAPILDETRIAPGQRLEVLEGSPAASLGRSLPLPDGVQLAEPDGDFTISVPTDSAPIPVTLRSPHLRFEETADGLSAGLLAGWSVAADLAEAIIASDPDIVPPLTRSVLRSRADAEPDESGECRDISVTLSFDAVPVEVAAP